LNGCWAGRAFDEFAWRMLGTGLPLLRVTLHSLTLHPQFLGTTFTWWRSTGQTVQTMIAHEVADLIAAEENPVRRVVVAGKTLRRRLDVADAALDFPILHELKAVGGTDYLALPVGPGQRRDRCARGFACQARGGNRAAPCSA
jgi:adenylate cyclase